MKNFSLVILLLFILSISIFAEEEEWDFVIDSTKAEMHNRSSQPKDKQKEKQVEKKDKKKEKQVEKQVEKHSRASLQKDEDKADKEDGMDFSGVKFESDDLDGELEKEEEAEIDKEISLGKKVQQVDIKKIKEEKKKQKDKKDMFLVFFNFKSQLDYQNLMLFDNIPYQNLLGFEVTTSILGLEFKNFDAYIGEIGYRIFYGNEVINSLVVSPLSISFYFKKWNRVFPLKVNLFKVYYFSDIIRGNSGEEISLFFEYISLNISWRIFRDDKYSSRLFFGVSFGPDDIKSNPKREAILFTIGVSGSFSPIKIDF